MDKFSSDSINPDMDHITEESADSIVDNSGSAQDLAHDKVSPQPFQGGAINREKEISLQKTRKARRRRNRLKPHEIHQQNQSCFENLFKPKHYLKFFIIRSNENTNLDDLHMLKSNSQITKLIGGKPKRITCLRDGTLLIEVDNEHQSNEIVKLHKLQNVDVTVSAHPTLNQIKGTIRNTRILKYSDDELLEDLNAQNETKVSSLYRMKKKVFKNNN